MDLLRKSQAKTEFKIIDTSDKVETKTKASPAATVTFAEDSEDLELGVDMLNAQAQFSQGAVVLLLVRFKFPAFAPFMGQLAVAMKFLQPLIP